MGVEPTQDDAGPPCNSFEDCEAHRDPYTSMCAQARRNSDVRASLLCHAE